MKTPRWFLVCVNVFLFAASAAADPITVHYVVYAPTLHMSGIYQITNAPGSSDVADRAGFPNDFLAEYYLTLTTDPLPPGATLQSALLYSWVNWYPLATNSTLSGVTPIAPGSFDDPVQYCLNPQFCPAEWVYYVLIRDSSGVAGVDGGPSFGGSIVYEDIGITAAAQLAAGATLHAYWLVDYNEHGPLGGYGYPGFNAQTQFAWELTHPNPAVLGLDITYEPAPVPEPGTLSLIGLGLLGLSRRVLRKTTNRR